MVADVGNRLHEARGQCGLDGYFNTLNQLTHLVFTGKVDVVGSVAATNATVLVNGYSAAMYNTSNYLGGVKLKPGSNTVNVVASYVGTTNRKEQVFAVFAPPTNPQQFLWDANGCLTNDGYASYSWDEENRLKQIETSTGYLGLERQKTEFLYDAQSRMVERKDCTNWTGSAYSATNTTRYIRDGYRVLAEIQSVGPQVTTNHFVWGLDLSQSLDGAGGIGGLLCRATASANSTWLYTYCGNGNVADVLDGTGAVIAHYCYDPFGRVVEKTGPAASSNQWQFSTKLFDSAWGLSLHEFRPYSPRLHTFMSPDPIGTRGGLNLYGFVANQPVGKVDWFGLASSASEIFPSRVNSNGETEYDMGSFDHDPLPGEGKECCAKPCKLHLERSDGPPIHPPRVILVPGPVLVQVPGVWLQPAILQFNANIVVESGVCRNIQSVWRTCARRRLMLEHEYGAIPESLQMGSLQNSFAVGLWMWRGARLNTSFRARWQSCEGGRWKTEHDGTPSLIYDVSSWGIITTDWDI